MKYSIKRQMMTVFVGLILFMIVVFMIVNGSFLEKYYISNKKSEFIKAYTMVQEGVENGTIDSETPEKEPWEDLQRKIIFPLQSSIQNTMWFILM